MCPARIKERTCDAGTPKSRLSSFVSNSCISSSSGLAYGARGGGALGCFALLQARRLRAARVEARAQGVHQVDHIAAVDGVRRLGEGDFLALNFFLNGRLDAALEFIMVFVGVEAFGGELIDQLPRQFELGLRHRRGLDPQLLE